MKTCTVLNACNLSPLDRATTLLDGAQEENEWFRETGDPSLLLSPTPVDPPLFLPNLFSRNLSWTKLIVQSDTNSRPRRDKISFYYKYRGYIYILLNYRLVLAVFSFFLKNIFEKRC